MNNFFIVTNAVKDPDKVYSNQIIKFLEENQMNCSGCIFSKETSDSVYRYADPGQIPDDTDLIMVIGGDGTFIHTAKDLIDLDLPIIGINFGNLGYLTEIDAGNLEQDLLQISAGHYHIENRMLIYGEIIRDGEVISSDIALNDVVLNRSQTMGIIDYEVRVNKKFLNRYSADGIILSTPTGSTGYNLSAGGPVVYPSAEIILATPICAHTLNSMTIVFSADSEIEVIVKERSSERGQRKIVSFDGQSEIVVENEDIIRVRKSEKHTKILRLSDISFVEQLGKKMR
ncbi:MAG: NAD(+)/NADH kinase [Lachnospiraceae bacterium]|nr:NAD(+)/NADH kinase [Lachnospiraceae bacterium]